MYLQIISSQKRKWVYWRLSDLLIDLYCLLPDYPAKSLINWPWRLFFKPLSIGV